MGCYQFKTLWDNSLLLSRHFILQLYSELFLSNQTYWESIIIAKCVVMNCLNLNSFLLRTLLLKSSHLNPFYYYYFSDVFKQFDVSDV